MNLLDLFLPSECVLCRKPPAVLCPSCEAELDFRLIECERFGLSGFALFDYNEKSAVVMRSFKTRGTFAVGKLLAVKLARLQPAPNCDALLCVPSSTAALRHRGFSPAELIAKTLGRHWRLPVATAKLTRQTADQASLGREARAANLAGAFAVPASLKGKRLWLVDDITTTGATLRELAAASRAAGAEICGFSVLAQTSLKTAT